MPRKQTAGHAKQLASLLKKDPEFLKYLQENDPELLQFGGSDVGSVSGSDSEGEDASATEHGLSAAGAAAGAGEDSDEDKAFAENSDESSDDEPERVLGATIPMPGDAAESDDDEEAAAAQEANGKGPAVLTPTKLDELIESAFREQRLRGLQYILHAFRAGAHSQDETPPTGLRFRIDSTAVFTRMLGSVLTNARAAFSAHLGGQVASVGPFTAVQLTKSKRFKKLSPLLQSFLTNLIHMLGHTLDASILLLLLRALKLYVPFFAAYPKLAQRLSRSLLKLYSAEFPPTVRIAGEGEEDHPEQDAAPAGAKGKRGRKRSRGDVVQNEADLASALADGPGHDGGLTVRAVTFLRLRQCAAELPYPTLDTVFKGVYLAYMRLAKNMASNEHRLPMARLMAAAVVELASLDATAAYQHGFTYLRQLALHLRAALTAKSPAAVTTVLSWQFLAALRAWTAVLIAHGSDEGSPLWQLVFPLTQLCMGVLQLTRTLHKYFYLRLHVLSCLVELGLRCSVFVPVPTHIMDLLESPHFVSGGGKAPKGGGGKPPSFSTTLRLTEGAVGSKPVLDHVIGTGTALLSRWLSSVWDSVAFPELVTPLAIRLRKWIKDARTGGWKGAGNNVLKSINARSKTVMGHRASTPGLAPSDLEAVAVFQTRSLASGNNALKVGGQAAADEALTALWHTGSAGAGGDGALAALGVGGVTARGTASAEAALHRAAGGAGDGQGDDAHFSTKSSGKRISWNAAGDSDGDLSEDGEVAAPAAVHAAKRARKAAVKSRGGAAAAPKKADSVQLFSLDGLDDSGDEEE